MSPTTQVDRRNVVDGQESQRSLVLPLLHRGRTYQATLEMHTDGWTVNLSDENGSTLPASGDFAATLLALQG
jgi:hypothetical protein